MFSLRPLFLLALPTLAAVSASVTSRWQPGTAVTTAVAADSVLLSGYKWRNIGPDRGGRSIAASGVKGRPNEAYFGATGGGLWKTTDGGETWGSVTDGQITQCLGRRGGGQRNESRSRLHRDG